MQAMYLSHPTSLAALFTSFWRNRELIWQMTKREVVGRYRGSIMGVAWSFFYPILMLAVYTFVFSVAFKTRWGAGGEESKVAFAIILFVGMVIHGLFAECVQRAPGLILSNVNFVKKVVFPLEILPWVSLATALFHAAISLLVLLAFVFLTTLHIEWSVVFLPLVILPLVLATMGAAWFLAAIGVFVRDIGQAIGLLTTVMMFLVPVFYPVSALPKEYQLWIHANPLTFIIEEARNVLIWGRLPYWLGLGIASVAGVLLAWAGFWWFQKTRKGFADVL